MKTKAKQTKEKLFAKAKKRVGQINKEKENTLKQSNISDFFQPKKSAEKQIKKAPTTLFGMEIRHNPKAHKFSVAMAMVGLKTDIPSADLILRLFDKIEEMGGKFDISSAVDLKLKVIDEYEEIREQFEQQINHKNI